MAAVMRQKAYVQPSEYQQQLKSRAGFRPAAQSRSIQPIPEHKVAANDAQPAPAQSTAAKGEAAAVPELVNNKKGKLTAQFGEPPETIVRERGHGHCTLHRGKLLGEGGFARVYEVREDGTDNIKAIKVISKDQLKTTKNRGKLFAEIKLHQAMAHPNIVHFEECFEDTENVYMVMQICPNGVSELVLDLYQKLTD